ncbi:MAG: hypothetical protein ABIH76_04245 [Candidatus Bathyarchaeota archaeon]
MIIEALKKLNKTEEEANGSLLERSDSMNCNYEVGVADGIYFNFLDDEEVAKFRKQITTKPFKIVDFILRTVYHYIKPDGKRASLRSDFQFLRFIFDSDDSFQIFVHHFRGARWMPLNELIQKITTKISFETEKRKLGPVNILEIRGHY